MHWGKRAPEVLHDVHSLSTSPTLHSRLPGPRPPPPTPTLGCPPLPSDLTWHAVRFGQSWAPYGEDAEEETLSGQMPSLFKGAFQNMQVDKPVVQRKDQGLQSLEARLRIPIHILTGW